jgi:hypothetical protein
VPAVHICRSKPLRIVIKHAALIFLKKPTDTNGFAPLRIIDDAFGKPIVKAHAAPMFYRSKPTAGYSPFGLEINFL